LSLCTESFFIPLLVPPYGGMGVYLEKHFMKLLLVRGRPGGFLRSLRNYSRRAGKYFPESRLLQTAYLLLHALSGSWLLGFDGLSAATQCSALSGNHRVTLIRYFFILLLVPPCGGMNVYLERSLSKVTYSARAPLC